MLADGDVSKVTAFFEGMWTRILGECLRACCGARWRTFVTVVRQVRAGWCLGGFLGARALRLVLFFVFR